MQMSGTEVVAPEEEIVSGMWEYWGPSDPAKDDTATFPGAGIFDNTATRHFGSDGTLFSRFTCYDWRDIADSWLWIDGNRDGIAERYYFDSYSCALQNTVTPDGKIVNANGAWVENGIVQTRIVPVSPLADVDYLWARNSDGTINREMIEADYAEFAIYADSTLYPDLGYNSYEAYKRFIDTWAENSARGAAWKQLFDRYQVYYHLKVGNNMVTKRKEVYIKTRAGLTEADIKNVEVVIRFLAKLNGQNFDDAEWKWKSDITDTGVIKVSIFSEKFPSGIF